MRTTVTLDPDTEAIIRKRMRDHGVSFKQALNEAIRGSIGGPEPEPFQTETASLGRSTVNLDRALQLAAQIDDDESIHRMRQGK